VFWVAATGGRDRLLVVGVSSGGTVILPNRPNQAEISTATIRPKVRR
jgi:hypothetical protein